MKKIGLMTLHHDKASYGACLQGYALWNYLSKENDCEMVDLPVTKNKEFQESVMIKIKVFVYKCLVFLKNFFRKCYWKALFDTVKREERFEVFNSKIKMSKERWTKEKLFKTPPSYDVWVSGSDQLWNPNIYFDIEPYLLGFTPDSDKRVSYASSLGVLEISPDYIPLFNSTIPRFHSVAMRESSAIPMIQQYASVKVENVLDPTFLLDKNDWRTLTEEYEIKCDYLFCYFLSYTKEIIDFCKEYARKLHLTPIFISTKSLDVLDFPDTSFLQDVGPSEFLYLLDESKFVLTDSFHGTAFSIIFEKQFITYIGSNVKRSSRIIDLLSSLGINNVISELKVIKVELDYYKIRECLRHRIISSKDYLNKSIA